MPGKSKPGGGLESSPVYKKSAFTMRSGNSPLFKQMGSSPVRNDKGKTITGVERPKTATGKAWGQEGAVQTYQESLAGIKSDMSKKDLREYVLQINKDKSATDASRISMKTAIKTWRGIQQASKSLVKGGEGEGTGTSQGSEEGSKKIIHKEIIPPTEEERQQYYYADTPGFIPSGEGGLQPLSDKRRQEIEQYISTHTKKGEKVIIPGGRSPATRKGGWWAKQVKGHGGPS
jgi:hypothetical protein